MLKKKQVISLFIKVLFEVNFYVAFFFLFAFKIYLNGKGGDWICLITTNYLITPKLFDDTFLVPFSQFNYFKSFVRNKFIFFPNSSERKKLVK